MPPSYTYMYVQMTALLYVLLPSSSTVHETWAAWEVRVVEDEGGVQDEGKSGGLGKSGG